MLADAAFTAAVLSGAGVLLTGGAALVEVVAGGMVVFPLLTYGSDPSSTVVFVTVCEVVVLVPG